MSSVTFDGDTEDDRRLWHSYVYWACERARAVKAKGPVSSAPVGLANAAIVDDPRNRVDDEVGNVLQTIVFSALALEYRLKRVLLAMQVPATPKETLGRCLNQFWPRLENVARLDGGGPCRPPAKWAQVRPLLDQLVDLRNKLAHANYLETLAFLGKSPDPARKAIELYNAFVDAIALINLGTGYETRSAHEVDAYFDPLRV